MYFEFSGEDADTVKEVFAAIKDRPLVRKGVLEHLSDVGFDDPAAAIDFAQSVIDNE